MAKKKKAAPAAAPAARPTNTNITVRASAPAARASSSAKPARRGKPGKKRSLLSRVAIAAAAGLVTGFGLYYADSIPGLGPWMHGGDVEQPMVPIRAAAAYGLIGGLSTWLTYKVTKDTTAAAGPAGVTATMVGFELYRHFTAPDEEEDSTAGLGRMGNAPYGSAGTQSGTAEPVSSGTEYVTTSDGRVLELRPVRPGFSTINGRPAATRPAPTSCDCSPGRRCGKPACTPRPQSCPTGSPRPRPNVCNVWAGPTAYC